MKKIKNKIVDWFNAEDISSDLGGVIFIMFFRIFFVGSLIFGGLLYLLFGLIFGF